MGMWPRVCFIRRFMKLEFCSIIDNAIFAPTSENLKIQELELVDSACTLEFSKHTCRS